MEKLDYKISDDEFSKIELMIRDKINEIIDSLNSHQPEECKHLTGTGGFCDGCHNLIHAIRRGSKKYRNLNINSKMWKKLYRYL